MATISYDGQSFAIDGRRIWLVSGAIHYPRTPRALWKNRLLAARQAGLNCIETYVFWNLHEPRPGEFHFEGDADLRAFVKLIGELGMYCILRPGPYVCAEWDFGGLPPWLHTIKDLALRQANGPYHEACSRYLSAVMEQVKDLQITHPRADGNPRKGPIIMVQAENEWFCTPHPPARPKDVDHLSELVRYLREAGCTTPINCCNNLWTRTDGTIDTWNALDHLAPDLRQLRVVQPNAPRLVTEYWPGWFDHWGGKHADHNSPDLVVYRVASMLAVGGQLNLYMFHGGTNFGFWGGRSIARPDCFMTTSYDYDAPLLEAGGRGPKYHAVRPLTTFASQFAHVFAHLNATTQPVVVNPDEADHDLSVIHQTGSQGDVVFLLRSPRDRRAAANLMLPNGMHLRIPLGKNPGRDRVAWTLLNANLGGVAELTFSSFRPLAFINQKLVVLLGPAASTGDVAIDHAPLTITVPRDKTPAVHEHEGLHIVVLNEKQCEAAYPLEDRLIVGAAALDADGQPTRHADWPTTFTIHSDGRIETSKLPTPKRRVAPRPGPWDYADETAMLDASSPRYTTITGPASLEQLGCDFGYGWYRLRMPAVTARKALAPQSGDRLHLYHDGKLAALLGLGPGAQVDPAPLKLDGDTVILADNLGRFCFGWQVGEAKGLFGHLYEVKSLNPGRPRVIDDPAPDPFALSAFWVNMRADEPRPNKSVAWRFNLTTQKPVILETRDVPAAVVVVNGRPVALVGSLNDGGNFHRLVLHVGEHLKRGRNDLRLALMHPQDQPEAVARGVRLWQATQTLTDKAEWSFAPWTVPAADRFRPAPKATPAQPAWYRTSFNVSHTDTPLWLEPRGMSKGQIHLNGHNVGRYFVATATGKQVPPQSRYYLPEPWIRTDRPNELLLFDEHGKNPDQARLAYDPLGPYGK
jgi:beta-galactosidase